MAGFVGECFCAGDRSVFESGDRQTDMGLEFWVFGIPPDITAYPTLLLPCFIPLLRYSLFTTFFSQDCTPACAWFRACVAGVRRPLLTFLFYALSLLLLVSHPCF